MSYPPKQILLPVDFSENSERAAAYAFQLAAAVSAKVHVLHAYMLPALPESPTMIAELTRELESSARGGLEQVAEQNRASGAVGQLLVKVGDPRDMIVRTAKELGIDLIIVGSHGRRGIKRMLLGSVAEMVVRTSPCPVLVVRADALAGEGTSA